MHTLFLLLSHKTHEHTHTHTKSKVGLILGSPDLSFFYWIKAQQGLKRRLTLKTKEIFLLFIFAKVICLELKCF